MVKFVWGKLDYRFAQCVLFHLRTSSGPGLPNLLLYFQAAWLAQLSIIYKKPDWVYIERQEAPTCTLDFLVWRIPQSRPPILSPKLSHCLQLRDSPRKLPYLISLFQHLNHIFHNPNSAPWHGYTVIQMVVRQGNVLHRTLLHSDRLLQFIASANWTYQTLNASDSSKLHISSISFGSTNLILKSLQNMNGGVVPPWSRGQIFWLSIDLFPLISPDSHMWKHGR